MFALKEYQQRTLKRLREFFELTLTQSVETAYMEIAHTKNDNGEKENPYAAPAYKTLIDELAARPHICARIPTGGGKTFMAANSLAVLRDYRAAAHGGRLSAPCVLWIVPGDAIRRQTVEMLSDNAHPCCQTIKNAFGENIRILDITDFDNVLLQDITDNGLIIVSTAAMFLVRQTTKRNEDGMTKETRRIYAAHENFYAHFATLMPNPPPADAATGLNLQYDEKGRVKHSFANLLHLIKPIVVCDEAHNFVSDLSRTVLRRLNPSCIMEWTATPRSRQTNAQNDIQHNLLVSVSAQELQNEDMVKLPFIVGEHGNWETAVQAAVLQRQELAAAAAQTADTVRPLVLYKATNIKGDAPAQKLKQHLITAHNIDEGEIAIATGEIKELDGVNLFSPQCRINHIITVEALREGWDCSFAYIFCSLDNISSETAIEQFLGRVMRMPFATKRAANKLNRGYVHLPSAHATAAVEVIRQKLSLHLGFDEQETAQMVQYWEQDMLGDSNLFEQNFDLTTERQPDFATLTEDEQKEAKQAVEIKQNPPETGGYKIIIAAPISQAVQEEIIAAVAPHNQPQQRQRLQRALRRHAIAVSPAKQGKTFAPLPQLMFNSPAREETVQVSNETLYELAEWNNLGDNFILSDFFIKESDTVFEVHMKGGKMQTSVLHDYVLPLLNSPAHTSRPHLVGWLKREIHDSEGRFTPQMLGELIGENLDAMINKGQTLAQLTRAKYQLANELRAWLAEHIKAVSDKTFKECVLDAQDLKCRHLPHFHPDHYPCGDKFYPGGYVFAKHYYGEIGKFDSGEETECAKAIDLNPHVRHWIRNVDSIKGSYSLPRNEIRNFYPDFVVELNNGKILIVEYKGAHLMEDKATKRDNRIGEILESVSGGQCFFVMPSKGRGHEMSVIYRQIETKINAIMSSDDDSDK